MSETITKKSLVDTIAERTGQKRTDVKKTLQELLDQIIDELGEGNRIEFRDFGVFEVKQRAPRVAQNPRTLEPVEVPSKRTVKFKPGRRMKQVMDLPTSAEQTSDESSSKSQAESSPASVPQMGRNPDVIGMIEPKRDHAQLGAEHGAGHGAEAQAMSPAGMTED